MSNSGHSDYEMRILDERWNGKLLQLNRRSPVRTGKLRIHFDRSPDVFTIPRLTSYRNRCLGLFRHDRLVGYVMASYQKRYINGCLSEVIYLGNMHVTEKGGGRVFLKKIADRFTRTVSGQTGVKYLYAYVASQNRPAMKLVELGQLNSMVIGQISMAMIMLCKPVGVSGLYSIRPATMSDVDVIVELLRKEYARRFLAPEMCREVFLQNLARRPAFDISNYLLAESAGRVVGVCSVWDMTSFKKNRVLTYGLKLGLARKIYNCTAPLVGNAALPKAGTPFRDVTVAEYAVQDGDPGILKTMLQYLYRQYRRKGYHFIIIGFSEGDPLNEATAPFIRRKMRSNVILGASDPACMDRVHRPLQLYADAVQI
ncbi:hypothetical protein SAMN06265218_10329 [Fodinibius sediminis]|uniref:N-acetyltransferase domain-containing protein n=2 Tax=Fodinibius sediminis TaxID=1214077 RepID=A0A521BE24_9BACT|nr:hypothetical protein SAMN06265218_10329 [Fodinibius sediminis]